MGLNGEKLLLAVLLMCGGDLCKRDSFCSLFHCDCVKTIRAWWKERDGVGRIFNDMTSCLRATQYSNVKLKLECAMYVQVYVKLDIYGFVQWLKMQMEHYCSLYFCFPAFSALV